MPKFMQYSHTKKKFSWHKSLKCPECAKQCVYCSVPETCAERFFLHYRVAFSSPYIPGRRKTKNTLNMTFSVYFPYLCATLSIQDSHLRKSTVSKVIHNGQEREYKWHTSATLECAPNRFVPYRRIHVKFFKPCSTKGKKWRKSLFWCYLCLSTQSTSK